MSLLFLISPVHLFPDHFLLFLCISFVIFVIFPLCFNSMSNFLFTFFFSFYFSIDALYPSYSISPCFLFQIFLFASFHFFFFFPCSFLFFSFCGSPLHPVYLFFFFSFLFPLAPFCLLSLGVCLDFFFFFFLASYSIGLAVLFVLLPLLFASFIPFSFFHYSIFCFLIIFPSFPYSI